MGSIVLPERSCNGAADKVQAGVPLVSGYRGNPPLVEPVATLPEAPPGTTLNTGLRGLRGIGNIHLVRKLR